MSKRTAFLLGLAIAAAWASATSAETIDTPRNIILFIGDGMGVSHVTAAKIVEGELNLERFNTMGLLTTHSQNAFVTDSAAAGTALATGLKTNNGAISVSPGGEPLKTALEYAEENGKTTGLVVSCSVTHATPAAFAAHVDNRGNQDIIAEHIAASGVDVLFGGGRAYFAPKSARRSNRSDEKNLLLDLEKRMDVIRSRRKFKRLGDVASVAGLFAAEHPPQAEKRKPKLPELTRKAVEILSKNKDGFFLMVEGSQIDWGGHNNDQDYIVSETIDFDEAVGVGLDFAEADGRTLVIVTSDHETGGFALHDGSVKEKKVTASGFTSKGHTAAMVPIFAYGPGSAAFGGIGDNTRVGQLTIQYLSQSN
ncbi:MAG TPA: alkaline phosphatase [Candidatus Hydrogenedentes bacterium]|nr:alkaline phosphatase [Candidatus Hydrogenedentota bacterium]